MKHLCSTLALLLALMVALCGTVSAEAALAAEPQPVRQMIRLLLLRMLTEEISFLFLGVIPGLSHESVSLARKYDEFGIRQYIPGPFGVAEGNNRILIPMQNQHRSGIGRNMLIIIE